jgi:hypothetical protein
MNRVVVCGIPPHPSAPRAHGVLYESAITWHPSEMWSPAEVCQIWKFWVRSARYLCTLYFSMGWSQQGLYEHSIVTHFATSSKQLSGGQQTTEGFLVWFSYIPCQLTR